MIKIYRLTGKQMIRVLSATGFEGIRIKGSHHYLRHSDGRSTVVPVHRGEIIGPGPTLKILRDIEMSKDEFMKILK